MKALSPPEVPGNTEAERMDNAVRKFFTVPKAAYLKEEERLKKLASEGSGQENRPDCQWLCLNTQRSLANGWALEMNTMLFTRQKQRPHFQGSINVWYAGRKSFLNRRNACLLKIRTIIGTIQTNRRLSGN